MPYASNDGIRIYYETQGAGSPLLLHHSLLGSLQSWGEYGYVDALKDDYQLIMMDARGHGLSDKPHNPEDYSEKQRVADMVSVLDDLEIEASHFWGYSYGGRAGFELAKYAPERVRSLIIGGGSPHEATPGEHRLLKTLESGIDSLIETYEQVMTVTPELRSFLKAQDLEALAAVLKAGWSSLMDDLPNMIMPCLIYAGEADESNYPAIQQYVPILVNANFVSLPGLNHPSCFTESEHILPFVKKFLMVS